MAFSLKQHFWKWFQQNNETYLRLNTMSKKEHRYWMDKVLAHLRSCGKNVYPYFFIPSNEATPQFVITACGNRKYFKQVERLISQAPSIPGWEIIGFHPPRPIDFFIEERYGCTGIDPHNLWFIPCLSSYDEPSGICVFADRDEVPDHKFEEAVRAVIRNLLGERSASLDLDWITVERSVDLTSDERSGLIKLQELPTYLERNKFSSLCNIEEGDIEEGK